MMCSAKKAYFITFMKYQYSVMLWSQIIFGHRTVTFSLKLNDSTVPIQHPAGGRKNCTIFYQIFRHRTVPGEV